MTIYTLRMLRAALSALPPNVLDLPVRAVTKTQFIERGPLEGCYAMDHVAISGIAFSKAGLFMFQDQSGNTNEQGALPQLPAHFDTGNPEIDAARRERDEEDNAGEEWKKGA